MAKVESQSGKTQYSYLPLHNTGKKKNSIYIFLNQVWLTQEVHEGKASEGRRLKG